MDPYYLFKYAGIAMVIVVGVVLVIGIVNTENSDGYSDLAKVCTKGLCCGLLMFFLMSCTAYGGKEYYKTKETRYDVLKASNYLKLEGKMHYKSSSFLGTGRSEFMMEFDEKNKFNFYYEEDDIVKHMELDYDFPIKTDTNGEAYMIKKIKYTKKKNKVTEKLEVVDEEVSWELHVPKDYFEENGGVVLN